MFRNYLFALLLLMLALPTWAQGSDDDETIKTDWDFSGHAKYQFIYASYPDNSIFKPVVGEQSIDQNVEMRLKLSGRREHWDFNADYQFIMLYGDTLRLSASVPGNGQSLNNLINDDRRWFNLTWSSTDDDKTALIHRLDRLSVGYTTENSVWRFGRQAISWGNGMIFTPMDIFNPFDPAAVDKEYKTGDDMLYGQYLFSNGSDLQGTLIVRRDPRTGSVEADQSSLALKYHGFLGMNEYDLLFAEHYDDQVLGAGGNYAWGGAVLRGDITWTHTDLEDVLSGVASATYSWTWGGKNISGVLEYFYNGFGQTGGRYSLEDLVSNPDLLKRLQRGELFNRARHYIGASATIEMTPLLMLIPNLFTNLQDPSALAQLVVQYDWKQNLQVLGALNLPLGSDGSEYGGTESPVEGLYFSSGPSVFAQLALYF